MRIKKNPGYSLLEILIAMTLASVVITAAVQSMGGVYFSQKKILIVQSFATETQFLMERLVQLIRTNTIDYDRYFVEVGPPDTGCATFSDNQVPDGASVTNNRANRLLLGYKTAFFWDTNDDDTQNRNLGGSDLSGDPDDCTQAWNGDQETLYLINGSQTLRIAVQETPSHEVQIEQQLGADDDGDGKADLWKNESIWDAINGICEIEDAISVRYEIIGDSHSREFCMQAHDWTIISPAKIEIETLLFSPAPNRDPFLGFAIDASQVHPNSGIVLETKLREPRSFGIEIDEVPNIALQTVVSSRVFGNIRQ